MSTTIKPDYRRIYAALIAAGLKDFEAASTALTSIRSAYPEYVCSHADATGESRIYHHPTKAGEVTIGTSYCEEHQRQSELESQRRSSAKYRKGVREEVISVLNELLPNWRELARM